jgi:glycosyltransferase involved in cell wall biosynthesis
VKPKVLVLHNHYQLPGGEDAVFAAESALLEANGHEVVRLTVHNDDLAGRSRAGMAADTIWNQRQYARVREVIRTEKPSVVHCHNTFPQFSPAVYYAAKSCGVPVVQTLHNFRLTCVNGLLFRDGRPCDKCVGSALPWRGALHACYRGDRPASAVAASMVGLHKIGGTYAHAVDRFIALTEFARQRFAASGLPAGRIAVKPNFARDRGTAGGGTAREGFLYVGRLSEEKGCTLLADAVRQMKSGATVTVVGDGPLREEMARAASELSNLVLAGSCLPHEVHERMCTARAVVIPSLCYEMFPVAAAEAFGAGAPVVASAHGGLTSIVEDGHTGRLFPPGDAAALARTLDDMHAAPREAAQMGAAARQSYETRYSPSANYRQLRAIYDDVIAARMVRSA